MCESVRWRCLSFFSYHFAPPYTHSSQQVCCCHFLPRLSLSSLSSIPSLSRPMDGPPQDPHDAVIPEFAAQRQFLMDGGIQDAQAVNSSQTSGMRTMPESTLLGSSIKQIRNKPSVKLSLQQKRSPEMQARRGRPPQGCTHRRPQEEQGQHQQKGFCQNSSQPKYIVLIGIYR